MTDFLDETHKEITSRLKDLKPLVDEYNRLEAAASALAKVIGSAASEASAAAVATVRSRRRRGRPRGSGSAKRASKATSASMPAATPAAAPAATPVKAARKKPGRPLGRKKVGRPPGAPPQSTGRTAQRRRQTRRAGTVARAGTAGHHHPRARGADGHKRELSLSRTPRLGAGREAGEERSRLAPQVGRPARRGVTSGVRRPLSRADAIGTTRRQLRRRRYRTRRPMRERPDPVVETAGKT